MALKLQWLDNGCLDYHSVVPGSILPQSLSWMGHVSSDFLIHLERLFSLIPSCLDLAQSAPHTHMVETSQLLEADTLTMGKVQKRGVSVLARGTRMEGWRLFAQS